MKSTILLLTITSSIYIACGQHKYEAELLEERIFSPCEDHPDNFIEHLFDMSNVNIEQTEDGSLVVDGFSIITNTVEGPLPVSVEIYKKQRGTWQPTIYTQKRVDTCAAMFGKMEPWHSYFKNTPEEQLKCPFTKGHRIDYNISEPTYIFLPFRNVEGEYKFRAEVGSESDDVFICVDIFAVLHKIKFVY